MNVGIIGAGNIGSIRAKLWVPACHQVLLSYARAMTKLRAQASALGPNARAGTAAAAAQFGAIMLLAVPWGQRDDAIAQAGSLIGKIVIDTNNPYGADGVLDLGERTSSEDLARCLRAREW